MASTIIQGLVLQQVVYAVLLVAVLLLVVVVANSKNIIEDDYSKYCTACNEAFINRRGFPDGFVFGSASGHYQIEGAYNESGKGPSMWDHFTHTYPEKIKDHTNGDIAIDSYHLYKEDVRILKDMGVDAYKFSISWARILPGGSINKGVNQEGIDYYNNLINELIANDIEPWVTMIHLDTSQALEDEYGGFLNPQIVADFRDFAEVLFREFGDRVKYWITINEPWGLSYLGYTRGIFAPGRCSPWIGNNCSAGDSATEPYKVTHNQLLAHAAAVKLYRTKYQEVQKGKIGLTVNSFWFVPYDERKENVEATYRALEFMLGWVLDPITFGKYPESMRSRVGGGRLPEFTNEEAEMVKGSFDFIGVNYYSANYAQHIDNSSNESYLTDSGALLLGEKDGIPIGEQGSSKSWYYMYPSGLRKLLKYIKEKYNDPLMYITENGLDEDRDDSIPMAEAINDYKRKDNFLNHLCCLREAIQLDGVNVKGFFAWSLTDNFEWISGYLVRFGLNYVDFNDKSFKRYPKLSAKWFKSILADRRVTGKTESRRISDQ